MFVLRSLFWLGLVFAALPWSSQGWQGDGTPVTPADVLEAARSAVKVAGSTGASAAVDYCSARPTECLKAAQQLQALFERVSAEEDTAAIAPVIPAKGGTLKPADKSPRWRGGAAG